MSPTKKGFTPMSEDRQSGGQELAQQERGEVTFKGTSLSGLGWGVPIEPLKGPPPEGPLERLAAYELRTWGYVLTQNR